MINSLSVFTNLFIVLSILFVCCQDAPPFKIVPKINRLNSVAKNQKVSINDSIKFEFDIESDVNDPLIELRLFYKSGDSTKIWEHLKAIQIDKLTLFKWRYKTKVQSKTGIEYWKLEIKTQNGAQLNDTTKIIVQAPYNYKILNELKLNNNYCFLSTYNSKTYNSEISGSAKDSIDFTYYFDSTNSEINIVSPEARKNSRLYEANAIEWGKIKLEIKKANLKVSDFNNLLPESFISEIYNSESSILVRKNGFIDGSHLSKPDTNSVYAFKRNEKTCRREYFKREE